MNKKQKKKIALWFIDAKTIEDRERLKHHIKTITTKIMIAKEECDRRTKK